MVWLITGASGQLGLAMQRELSTRGINFIAANSRELNITSQNSVESILLRNSPKVIVNCAAWTDVDLAEIKQEQAYNVNALAVKNLALASKRISAKLVHVSTDYVFSGEGNRPWLESAERDPASIYGLSKREGENFVQEIYEENSFIVRTAWLYSENGKNFAKTMANLALTDEREVRVVNDQIGQPTSANDLAHQIVDLVESKSTHGIYHGTSSGQATWFEFAQKIFELIGANTERVVPVSSDEFQSLAKRPRYSVLGHDNWRKSELPEMRDWRLALADEIPRILFTQRQDRQP
jgi:dTDP-4-dehydrorhamnose reductase